MWINNYKWEIGVTNLQKFFVERIIQRCDYLETISNRHRTINGYIQLKELIKLSELSQKREKTIRTLIVIIEEANSNSFSQNICHDLIINQYFDDLKKYVKKFDPKSLGNHHQPNLSNLRTFLHELKKFENQLDAQYYGLLKSEILKIDMTNDDKYGEKAERLSKLIDILIPYLVFKGYSTSSISEVLIKWLKRGFRPLPSRFINFFSFQNKEFYFLINLKEENQESLDFSKLLKENYSEIDIIKGSELGDIFREKNNISDNHLVAKFKHSAIDPHSHIRNSYDELLKKILIHKERPSLSAFNNYFDQCFWSTKPDEIKLKRISVDSDPINVNARNSTLRKTLTNSALQYGYIFNEEDLLPIPKSSETLKKAIYYYNIALGSKSIENSLSLLWTSLETILPYRFGNSDIESIQNFVAKSLCIGAYSRDVFGFSLRFIQTNQINGHCLNTLKTRGFESQYTTKGLIKWFEWLRDDQDKEERMKLLKSCSELIAFNYVKLGKPLSQGKLEYFSQRIKSSEDSIKFQLQRIYLYRNQIVHSGDLVNEYTNLWIHLEWYVGKLLAIALIKQDFLKLSMNIGDIYREIESDYDYIMSYLESNKNKKIGESERILPMLFSHIWQSF